jgi:hypothetical protein
MRFPSSRRPDWCRLLSLLLAAAPPLLSARAELVDVAAATAVAERAGLRVLESSRLVLVTDRPPRDGDGVADLPRIFDEAVAVWCDHYGMDPAALAGWRCLGCLVMNRERFREAGLLPPEIPAFVNGFCDRNRFWLMDQPNPAYRRHLLLHEGAHAFTLTVRGLATPVWYNEGIAEYLATHRLDDAHRFVPTPIPARADDVEQLGRIERIRELRATATAPALADVFAVAPALHHDIAAYASSWAAVALLRGHPAYAESFAALERGRLGPDFNARVAALPGFDAARAARDFDALTDDLDYGYDFARSAIDWSSGRPLDGPARVAVPAGRGWQNAGIDLRAASRCRLHARGRCTLGRIGDTAIETEPDGVSLDWYRGRPIGRLLAAQWVEAPPQGGRPRFVVLGEGAAAAITAAVDGPLFLRVNEPPADLADDAGEFTVEIAPDR